MGITDLLNSSGSPSFSFDTIGASVAGTVIAADVVQRRDFDTMAPMFWDDGKPVNQVRVTIATSLREATPDGTPDDGHRAVYIKGWGDQLKALRAAIKQAGATDMLPGGTFTATYTGDIPVPEGKRGFPSKMYGYSYQAPSQTAGLLAQPTTAATTPPPTWAAQEAAHQPPPALVAAPVAAAPPGMTPDQMARFMAWSASQPQSAS